MSYNRYGYDSSFSREPSIAENAAQQGAGEGGGEEEGAGGEGVGVAGDLEWA